MLRAPHILAAALCLILVLNDRATADPGRCPIPQIATANWTNLESHDGLAISWFWELEDSSQREKVCKNWPVSPPQPLDSLEYVGGIVGTDNRDYVVYMECYEDSQGHNKTIRTYTDGLMYPFHASWQPLYEKIKSVHVANGFDLKYLHDCWWYH